MPMLQLSKFYFLWLWPDLSLGGTKVSEAVWINNLLLKLDLEVVCLDICAKGKSREILGEVKFLLFLKAPCLHPEAI